MSSDELNNTAAQEPANAPGRAEMPVEGRAGADAVQGTSASLSWGARSDVGLVRGHNEDSFLIQAPLFAVCDGMGGHAAGEVASAIAVRTIAEKAPAGADDVLLGAAVEAANTAVIQGAEDGVGKPGMGCTASCCLLEEGKMSVAHVGDSRIYLLRRGTIVRVTHDHSYVEELVDAGEITADEARVHPSRSIITRALGSDPDMYADHFSLDIEHGDRIIICSDGLSSMVPDSGIETIAVSTASPIDCTDQLVSAALVAGGHDNVSVIVVDVVSDGREEQRSRARKHAVLGSLGVIAGVVVAAAVVLALIVNNSWYIGASAGNVGIYKGIRGSVLGIPLSELVETSSVSLQDLPEATQHQLAGGITVDSVDKARATVSAYARQIEEEQAKAQKAASDAQSESTDGSVGSEAGDSGPEAAQTQQGGE